MPNPLEKDGTLLVGDDGAPLDCDRCCEVAAVSPGNACCADGIIQSPIYLYGYFWRNAAYGCLGLICTGSTSGSVYETHGTFKVATIPTSFSWNGGSFTVSGAIGCASASLTGVCTPAGVGTGGDFITTLFLDFGGGHTFSQVLNHLNVQTDHGGGVFTAKCTLVLGCQTGSWSGDLNGAVAVLQYDPTSAGIRCPDGNVVPITIQFHVRLSDSVGHTTVYTCDLIYSPKFSSVPGITPDCFAWSGYLLDCSCACTAVSLFWDGSLWNLQAFTSTGSGDFINIYNGVSFPPGTPTPCIDNWKTCGGDPNTTPDFSVTP